MASGSLSTIADRTYVKAGGRSASANGYCICVSTHLPTMIGAMQRMAGRGASSVFQNSAWIDAWSRTMAKARGVDVFLVEVQETESRNPVLLLPLVRRVTKTFTLIESPDFGLADYTGPIVARSFLPSSRTMRQVWARILDALPPADFIRLVKMPETINGAPNPFMLLGGVQPSDLTAYGTRIYGPYDACERAIMPEKKIADLDARWRKLNKRGKVEFRVAATDAEAERFFDAMCEQRAARFADLQFPNALAKPEVRAFYRALLRPDCPAAPARIQALLIDGEIIATGYGLVGNGAFHMIFPTFRAEKWRNYSPGMHLFRQSIAWAVEQGLTYYDFTVGAEGFKRDFGAREMPLFERYEALSFSGAFPVAFIDAKRFIKRHPKLAAAVCGLKSCLTGRN